MKIRNGRKADAALASVLFVACFALYLITLAPTVVFDSSGGYSLSAVSLGVYRAPGFSLYAQFGSLFQLFPGGDPAFKMNVMSAFFGALGAAALFAASRGFGVARFASWLGAAACALSPALWSRAAVADRHTLDFLLVALFLLCVSRTREQGGRALAAAALTAALASLNGVLFAVALVPALAAVALFARGRLRRRPALPVAAFVFSAAAALPIFVPLRSAAAPFFNWGNAQTPALFLEYMRGARLIDLENKLAFQAPELAGLLANFIHNIQIDFFTFHILLGLIGFALMLSDKPRRAAALAWPAAVLSVGAILAFSFHIDESGAGALRAQHIGAYAAMAVFIAAGADGVVRRISETRLRSLAPAAAVLLVVSLAFPMAGNLRAADMSRENRAETLGLDLLKRLPRDSAYFAQGPQFALPAAYVSRVRNLRADVEIIDASGGYIARNLDVSGSGSNAAGANLETLIDRTAGANRLRRPQAFDFRRPLEGAPIPMKQRGPFFFISDSSGCDIDGWDPATYGFTPETTVDRDYDTRLIGPLLKLRQAECDFARGADGVAFNLVQEAAADFPDSSVVRFLAGAALENRGYKNEALERYQETVSMCGSCAEAIARIGGLMVSNGEYHSATVYYQRALDRRPGLIEAEIALANITRLNGELAAADELYAKLLAKRPDSIVILNNYANLKAQLRRVDDAEKMFRKALDIDPDSSFTALNFSSFLLDTGRTAEAARLLEAALERNPYNPSVMYNAAVAAHRAGDLPASAEYYNSAVALDPDMLRAWTNLALLYLDSNMIAEAREAVGRMNREVSDEFREEAFLLHLKTEKRAVEYDPMDEAGWGDLIAGLIIMRQRSQAEAALGDMRKASGGKFHALEARLQRVLDASAAASQK